MLWNVRPLNPYSVGALLASGLAVLLGGAVGAHASTTRVSYERCRHGQVTVHGSGRLSLRTTDLRVSRMSCTRAKAALQRSTFEATPGGPLFSTAGFGCGGPVGPPPPHSQPRYYHCSDRDERFEFLVPGFS